jgi:hypothetical protein
MAEPSEHVLGMKDVELNAREMRLVTDSLQPAVEEAERPIPRQEAWNQQHRARIARGHPASAENRIPQQS